MASYRSFAKINLHLQVIGRRPDGYHELRTVFQTVDLHDRLEVDLADDGVELEIVEGEAPPGSANLAVAAAAAFLRRWAPGRGVRLRLAKRIPVGGGLGGGSSNAATVLLALRRQLGIPAAVDELWPLARALGADVPYFLIGGTALGVGRGDEVLPLPELPEAELWLATPPQAVSTAEIFGALRDLTAEPAASSILALARGTGARSISELNAWNDLEPVVFARYPLLRDVYNRLEEAGARPVRLSGTGATLFACFKNRERDPDLGGVLPAGCRMVRARTLSRGAIEASWAD